MPGDVACGLQRSIQKKQGTAFGKLALLSFPPVNTSASTAIIVECKASTPQLAQS